MATAYFASYMLRKKNRRNCFALVHDLGVGCVLLLFALCQLLWLPYADGRCVVALSANGLECGNVEAVRWIGWVFVAIGIRNATLCCSLTHVFTRPRG